VIEAVRSRGVPLVIALAGGYAATRARTAELHAHAIREAAAYERRELLLSREFRCAGTEPRATRPGR
jgi:hypothetical protein